MSLLADEATAKGGIIEKGMAERVFGKSLSSEAVKGSAEATSRITKIMNSVDTNAELVPGRKLSTTIEKTAAEHPEVRRVVTTNKELAENMGVKVSVQPRAERFTGPVGLPEEPLLASNEELSKIQGLKQDVNALEAKGNLRDAADNKRLADAKSEISKIEGTYDAEISKLKSLKLEVKGLEDRGLARTDAENARLTEARSEISKLENTDAIKSWYTKWGDSFDKTLRSEKPLEWTKSVLHAVVSGLFMGIIFSVPQMIQSEITAKQKSKNFKDAVIALGNFGNVNMQIPPSFVDSSHPELSPFLYFQVNPNSKSGDTYAYVRGGHAFVSADQGTWAQSYLQDPRFPGVMIDLATGYQFTQDGQSHDRPMIPLLGTMQVAWGLDTVSSFLNTFLSKLKQGKLPMYSEGLEAPSAISAPSGFQDYWNNLMNVIAASCEQLKTNVIFGTIMIQPFVPRVQPYQAGKGYLPKENLPANGVYIYQSDKTPLVKYARLAGNTELVDYIVALDAYGNIIPAHAIINAKSGAFMPNSAIVSVYSLLNNKVYKADGSMFDPQTPFSFDEYGSQLQKWADPSGKYKYLKAQTQYMQKVAAGGPFTPLQLTLYYKDDAHINNLLSANPQFVPVYTSTTTLGKDANGMPILDYFIAVGISGGQFVPVNLFNTQPVYLISLVTSRIYTPQGNVATTAVNPTDQVASQLVPSIQAAVDAQAQAGTPLSTVAIGQKYMPGALNPYGLPFPSNYFTIIYGLDQDATKDNNGKTLNDKISASRASWGSPYKSQINNYQYLTSQLNAEQAKAQPDKSKISSLLQQLADASKTIAAAEATLGQKLGMCQFTKGLLFDIYFKVPTADWIHSGNYFYQSVPGTSGAPVFAPGEYFVMSDSADSKSLTDVVGLSCDSTTYPYAISINSGNVYDTTGNKLTDSSGKAITFDVNQLLVRVQQNQIKAGGFAFMQNGQGINDIGKTIVASIQSWNNQVQQDLGPFSFYQFTLTIPSDFVAAFKNGQYVYYATCPDVPAYQDYLICIEQTTDGKQNFGVKYSSATIQVVSLVTGMAYSRSGLFAQYDQNQLYQLISAQYQGISAQVKSKIQAQAADFAKLSTPKPAPASPMPTFGQDMIAQLSAQQEVLNHPGLYQDPASGKFYKIDSVYKTTFDFNAPENAIKLLYPQEVASGQYKSRIGDVGIMYDSQGNYLVSLSGWALQNTRAAAGVYVNPQGQQQLMPSNVIPLPLNPKDQNLKPGASGQGLIASTDPKFPTPNVASVQDPTDPNTIYYFYYLSQGTINSKQTTMNSYLVRQVNTALQTDRYIDINTGYTFKPDGSLAAGQTEFAKDSLGQTMQIFRQSGDLAAVSIGDTMFNVWDEQQQSDGSTMYNLNDDNYNNLQIKVSKSVTNYVYNVSLDASNAMLAFDKSGNPTNLGVGNFNYVLATSGTNQWKDSTNTIQMSLDTSVTDQIVYLVQFLKTPSATSTKVPSNMGSSTINYAVKIIDTYTGSTGINIVNTLTGAAGTIILDQGKPQMIQYNGLSYAFKQAGKTANEYIMYNADQALQLRIVVQSTGVNIYTTTDPKEVAKEYAFDAELIPSASMINFITNVWQLRPAVDIYANNYLVAPLNKSLLKQVGYSDLVVDDADKDLYSKAINAGVFMLPMIFYDGINQRYLYQFTNVDAGMPYYNSDYNYWYIELIHGFAFDDTGFPAGISFPINTLNQLLGKFNIGVANDKTGMPKIKFIPGGNVQTASSTAIK